MAKGMEDSAYWNHPSRRKPIQVNQRCRKCKQVLGGRHCDSAECPWCASCGKEIVFRKD